MFDRFEVFAYCSELFVDIFTKYFNFLFFEFFIVPPPLSLTLGDLLLSTLILSVLFKLFISVPNTKKGGGKRAKGSKKGSSSSSSDSSDS